MSVRELLKASTARFDSKKQIHLVDADSGILAAGILRACIEKLEAPSLLDSLENNANQVRGHEPVVLTPETRRKAKAKLEELKQAGFQPVESAPAPQAQTGIRIIPLEQIIADDSVQSRAQLDMLAVAEYAQALEDGNQDLPPVTVFADGTSYWLSDGYHRHAAHKAAGRAEINCDVRLGNKRAALLHSAGSNQQHGLRRSNADKRRAVEMVLRDPEWATWTDRAIGLHCGVDGKTVATVRAEFRRCSVVSNLEPVDQGGLFKPVQPDPEDVVDYLESVQAAEETPFTSAQLDAVLEPTMAQESPKPAPVFGMPEAFVLERERLTDGLMRHCEHLNDEQQKLRLEYLNSLNLEKLRIEFAEYASGSAARALNLKRLPDWDQLPGGSA